MEVRPEKVIEAMACLNVTADHLLKRPEDDLVAARLAAECIKCAAALHASLQISGLRTIQTVGGVQ
jgi:hypothetical protein